MNGKVAENDSHTVIVFGINPGAGEVVDLPATQFRMANATGGVIGNLQAGNRYIRRAGQIQNLVCTRSPEFRFLNASAFVASSSEDCRLRGAWAGGQRRKVHIAGPGVLENLPCRLRRHSDAIAAWSDDQPVASTDLPLSRGLQRPERMGPRAGLVVAT